jgi:transposase-like protein
MDARKRSQRLLANDWGLGPGCLAVSERVWFEDRDGVRVVCVRNTPFYTYDLNDRVQHLFCACQLIEAQLAKQCQVARAFGISEPSLQRARRRVRDHGIAGLVPQKKGPKRRHRGGGAVGRRIVKLWKKGARRLEIAARLGLSEGTVPRNLIHPPLPRQTAARKQSQMNPRRSGCLVSVAARPVDAE